ncbi:hypothetical protein AB4254_12230 [Vibrio breoganii]
MNKIEEDWLNDKTGEYFDMLMRRFDVDAAKQLILENKVDGQVREAESYHHSKIGNFSMGIAVDDAHVEKMEDSALDRPLIMAQIEKDSYILVDGHHRLKYARNNDKAVKIWMLSVDETVEIQNCPRAFRAAPEDSEACMRVVGKAASRVYDYGKRHFRTGLSEDSEFSYDERVDKMLELVESLEHECELRLKTKDHPELIERIYHLTCDLCELLDGMPDATNANCHSAAAGMCKELWSLIDDSEGVVKELMTKEPEQEVEYS